jgi:hypothetical protein
MRRCAADAAAPRTAAASTRLRTGRRTRRHASMQRRQRRRRRVEVVVQLDPASRRFPWLTAHVVFARARIGLGTSLALVCGLAPHFPAHRLVPSIASGSCTHTERHGVAAAPRAGGAALPGGCRCAAAADWVRGRGAEVQRQLLPPLLPQGVPAVRQPPWPLPVRRQGEGAAGLTQQRWRGGGASATESAQRHGCVSPTAPRASLRARERKRSQARGRCAVCVMTQNATSARVVTSGQTSAGCVCMTDTKAHRCVSKRKSFVLACRRPSLPSAFRCWQRWWHRRRFVQRSRRGVSHCPYTPAAPHAAVAVTPAGQ